MVVGSSVLFGKHNASRFEGIGEVVLTWLFYGLPPSLHFVDEQRKLRFIDLTSTDCVRAADLLLLVELSQ